MIACPVCRAENTAGPNCRRCKADLSILFAIESECTALLQLVYHRVAESRWDDALQSLDEIDELRFSEQTQHLRAAILLLAGRREEALGVHGAITQK